ncbi:hypothetical protein IID62_09765 [candidate division KSB1 bacterium]|nr:hypothetical protein [candidate division KSB1 bacterium]
MKSAKKRLFSVKKPDEDFVNRQLTDTAYFSKETKKYLRSVFKDLQAVKGGTTFLLRRYWGLNSVLGRDVKNREDHRHHAVDALVVACTTRSNLQKLSVYHRLNLKKGRDEFLPPWEGFRDDAVSAVNNILVSHKFKLKTTGQLHEDTYYGRLNDANGKPMTDEKGNPLFVVRKNLKNLTPKQAVNIVDQVVRGVVLDRIDEKGGDTSKKKFTIPKNAFTETLYMPDEKTPVKKVRVFVAASNMIQLYEDRKTFVEPGNNHHIAIFEHESGKRDGVVVSLFEVTRRKRHKEPVFDKTAPLKWGNGWKFVMTLSINELMLIYVDEEKIIWNNPCFAEVYSQYLYRVQKMDVSKKITFRHHLTARLKDDNGMEVGRIMKMPNTLIGIKIKINPLGRISKADD